jgi:hypothetical protein
VILRHTAFKLRPQKSAVNAPDPCLEPARTIPEIDVNVCHIETGTLHNGFDIPDARPLVV